MKTLCAYCGQIVCRETWKGKRQRLRDVVEVIGDRVWHKRCVEAEIARLQRVRDVVEVIGDRLWHKRCVEPETARLQRVRDVVEVIEAEIARFAANAARERTP